MAKKEGIRKLFDRIAPDYDKLNHILSLNIDKGWRRKAVREIADTDSPLNVLDVACGTADFTIEIARSVSDGSKVTGIDLSEGMMAIGRSKISDAGVKAELVQGDCEDLQFGDDVFDRISVGFGVRNFEHLDIGLKEMCRVLKKGGKLVILELSVPSNAFVRWCYKLYFLKILPAIGGWISGERSAYEYLPASVLRFPAPEDFMEMMREAGFTEVSHRSFTLGICRMYIGIKTADPMGAAIYDFHRNGKAGALIVRSSMFDDDEIPVADLFRDFEDMPELEQTALQKARGRVLDVGAGAGCHSLALKKMGKEAVAIDISTLSVMVMKERGLDARQVNFYDESFNEGFDTILMLMNGTGIIGTLDNVPSFFDSLKRLLNPGGCVYIDSSDLRYLFEEEDGSLMIDLADDYYGQVDYQMLYDKIEGEPFDWLYLDFNTLAYYAEENGFSAELVAEGEHYDYLACLTLA